MKRDAGVREGALEPHIRNAAAVAAQVVEADKSVEMLQDDGAHRIRFCEPQIDGDAAGRGGKGTFYNSPKS